MLDSTVEVERLLLAAAPGALPLIAQLEEGLPAADETLLDSLPISIYGGG
ncbi:MAG: hypothetical protein H0T13_05680 [Actinobacteria bacterium]|nr:hypothetical protein [Actinomycetota bacterium]